MAISLQQEMAMLQDTKSIPGGSVKFPAASGGEFVPERLKALIMLAAGGINNLNFFTDFTITVHSRREGNKFENHRSAVISHPRHPELDCHVLAHCSGMVETMRF